MSRLIKYYSRYSSAHLIVNNTCIIIRLANRNYLLYVVEYGSMPTLYMLPVSAVDASSYYFLSLKCVVIIILLLPHITMLYFSFLLL